MCNADFSEEKSKEVTIAVRVVICESRTIKLVLYYRGLKVEGHSLGGSP